MTVRMGIIDDTARRRLRSWLDASRGRVTQEDLARALHKKQNYVSRYLDGIIYRIELDSLATMAGVFGHTLCELLDSQPSTAEGELIECFRAMSPEGQAAFLGMAREMIRAKRP
jgi:transcriptional regulator with XRE-family HTH domain